MNNDIQNLVNELNSTTPKTQMYMIQLCRSAINNLYDLTDTIEENISSIQTSVVANTSAISGLQGSIDLINTNLNVYLSRIEALETKTTYISKTENNSTRIENSLIVQNDIDADGLYITGDITAEGEIVGRILESNNDNGRGRFYIDSDGDMALSLPPNAGKLITTGNISEYEQESKTYLHRISFQTARSAGKERLIFSITIQNGNNNAFTFNDICDFLKNLGFTSEQYLYNANGLYHEYSLTEPYTYHTIAGVWVDYSLKRINFVSENNTYEGVTKYADTILSQTAIEL